MKFTETKDFDPIDIQVLLRVEKIETGKLTDNLITPDSHKKDKSDFEKVAFFVEKLGPEIGKGREPYWNRSPLEVGQEVMLRATVQAFNRRKDDTHCIILAHDILGVNNGEKADQ